MKRKPRKFKGNDLDETIKQIITIGPLPKGFFSK